MAKRQEKSKATERPKAAGGRTYPHDYPKGAKRELTPELKAAVLAQLARNEANGIEPGNFAALARMLGKMYNCKANKSGIGRMLQSKKTNSSKFRWGICKILDLDPETGRPLTAVHGPFEDVARRVRLSSKDLQDDAARILEALLAKRQ